MKDGEGLLGVPYSFEEHRMKELTFEEIKKLYGEETAINAGIAADPDTFELDEEWFKEARPAREVDPGLFED